MKMCVTFFYLTARYILQYLNLSTDLLKVEADVATVAIGVIAAEVSADIEEDAVVAAVDVIDQEVIHVEGELV